MYCSGSSDGLVDDDDNVQEVEEERRLAKAKKDKKIKINTVPRVESTREPPAAPEKLCAEN